MGNRVTEEGWSYSLPTWLGGRQAAEFSKHFHLSPLSKGCTRKQSINLTVFKAWRYVVHVVPFNGCIFDAASWIYHECFGFREM